MTRILLSLFLMLGMLSSALGQVAQADETLVGSRQHSLLKRLHDSFSFPDTVIPEGKAVVTVNIEGPNLTVMIVGPIRGKAKEYGERIEEWRKRAGIEGKTEYAQEDDCSAASFVAKTGGFGKMESKLDIPIADLISSCKGLENQVSFALTAPKWTNLNVTAEPGYVAKNGSRIWDITNPGPIDHVVSTLTIPAWVVPALIAWVFIPLVGMAICFGLGIAAAKNQKISIEKRRRLYSMFVVKGTYVTLGIHGLLVIATLPTRALDPISQLWFGFRFSQIGLFIVPLFVLVPVLLLPWLNKVETKLLGATPEEAATKEDFSMYQTDPTSASKARTFPRIPLLAVFVLLIIPFDRFGSFGTFGKLLAPILLLFILGSTLFRLRKGPVEAKILNSEGYLARVQNRIVPIANRLEIVAPPVAIGLLLQGPYGCAVTEKEVRATPALADRFTDGELDFVLAHELAHLKVGHLKTRRVIVIAPLVLFFVLFNALLWGRSVSVVTPNFIFSPFLLMLVISPIYAYLFSKLMQKQEFEADEIAVRVTRDKANAIQALTKITQQNSLPGFDDSVMNRTHPKVADRIARIRALANV